MGNKTSVFRVLVLKLETEVPFGRVGVDERTVFKWILNEAGWRRVD
jgi:hypothetical protein